jgi:hypothetical protein
MTRYWGSLDMLTVSNPKVQRCQVFIHTTVNVDVLIRRTLVMRPKGRHEWHAVWKSLVISMIDD